MYEDEAYNRRITYGTPENKVKTCWGKVLEN